MVSMSFSDATVSSAPYLRQRTGLYWNPRLRAENYACSRLSSNPATRLRQMLTRPGILVSGYDNNLANE